MDKTRWRDLILQSLYSMCKLKKTYTVIDQASKGEIQACTQTIPEPGDFR